MRFRHTFLAVVTTTAARPHHLARHLDWALLLPLALVGTNASFQILTGRLAHEGENPITTHVLTGWIGTALTSCLLPFVWAWPDNLALWMQLLLMGLAATLGHYLLLQAYAHANAATLMPCMYVQIAFAVFGGWLVFGHVPDPWTLSGMALVALCGALGAWLSMRESRIPIELPEF